MIKQLINEILDMNGGSDFAYGVHLLVYVSREPILSCNILDLKTGKNCYVSARDNDLLQTIHDETERMMQHRESFKQKRIETLKKELSSLT